MVVARSWVAWVNACAIGLAVGCGPDVSSDPLAAPRREGSTGGNGSSQGGSSASGGSAAPGRSSAGQGTLASDGLANGADGCRVGSDCASSVCLADVSGIARCCAVDCRALGRVCSTAGQCVCEARAQEVGGECLLVDGQACRADQDCAGNHCVDQVCCNSACDRVCERCDAPGHVGECAIFSEDPGCVDRNGFQCSARGRCRLPVALTCGSDSDCESDQCEQALSGAALCCDSACSGVCQRCGMDGVCDARPASDERCPNVTCPEASACIDYRAPAPAACSAPGVCAACEPIFARNAQPCGVGKQCDGAGSCRFTGRGSVAAGTRHTCAIRANGNVVCWGTNVHGELGAAFDRDHVGDNEPIASVRGLELDFARDVVALTAGFAHTCALFDDGNVRCWGKLVDDIQFGTVNGLLGTNSIQYTPSGFVDPFTTGNVRLPEPATQISAATGGAHTCALLRSGNVVCWGFNGDGQCGNGSVQNVEIGSNEYLLPIALGGARALEVKAAPGHTCVLLEGGRVKCWGEGNLGRLGYGDTTDRLEPQEDVAVGGVTIELAVGLAHTCALLAGGHVRCWGANNQGQLGYGHAVNIGDDETPQAAASLPGPNGRALLGGDVPVGHGGGVVQLTQVSDSRAMCARFQGGAVRCWGQNDKGQLGYGHAETLGAKYTPDELEFRPAGAGRIAGGDVPLPATAQSLADGGRCALLVDGSLYCWGDNEDGELGLPAQFPAGSQTLTPTETGPVTWE